MTMLKKTLKNQNGNVIVLFALIFFIVLAIGGIVVDASELYTAKSQMRKAANSAALSGAQVYYSGNVSDISNQIVDSNSEDHNNAVVTKGSNKVTVKISRDVSTNFMKVFKISKVPVEVTSIAALEPEGESGVRPIGISDLNISAYHFGDAIQLTYSPGNGAVGNYGFLNFSEVYENDGTTEVVDTNSLISHNNGADSLRDYIKYGFGPDICPGYKIDTETGINESVQNSVNGLIGQTITIVIYSDADLLQGKSALTVVGFAQFTITGYDKKTATVNGTFVQKLGSVTGPTNDIRIYGVKLVEN